MPDLKSLLSPNYENQVKQQLISNPTYKNYPKNIINQLAENHIFDKWKQQYPENYGWKDKQEQYHHFRNDLFNVRSGQNNAADYMNSKQHFQENLPKPLDEKHLMSPDFENTLVNYISSHPVTKHLNELGWQNEADNVRFNYWKQINPNKTSKDYFKQLNENKLGKAETMKKLPADQLLQGYKVEAEHTDKPTTRLKIASDHLNESPDYYKKLDIMENTPLSRLQKLRKCMTKNY